MVDESRPSGTGHPWTAGGTRRLGGLGVRQRAALGGVLARLRGGE